MGCTTSRLIGAGANPTPMHLVHHAPAPSGCSASTRPDQSSKLFRQPRQIQVADVGKQAEPIIVAQKDGQTFNIVDTSEVWLQKTKVTEFKARLIQNDRKVTAACVKRQETRSDA
jgi:hypothetical protein